MCRSASGWPVLHARKRAVSRVSTPWALQCWGQEAAAYSRLNCSLDAGGHLVLYS